MEITSVVQDIIFVFYLWLQEECLRIVYWKTRFGGQRYWNGFRNKLEAGLESPFCKEVETNWEDNLTNGWGKVKLWRWHCPDSASVDWHHRDSVRWQQVHSSKMWWWGRWLAEPRKPRTKPTVYFRAHSPNSTILGEKNPQVLSRAMYLQGFSSAPHMHNRLSRLWVLQRLDACSLVTNGPTLRRISSFLMNFLTFTTSESLGYSIPAIDICWNSPHFRKTWLLHYHSGQKTHCV